MQRDQDVEARLRTELRAEVQALPYHVDSRVIQQRLAERPSGGWWRLSGPVLGGLGGAVALLAVVMVAAIALRGLPRAGTGSGVFQAAPAHALLVTEVINQASEFAPPKLEAHLVNPATLAAVGGVPSVKLGVFYQTALSHDARTLAVIRWPSDNVYGADLLLVDVASGAVTATGVKVDGDVPFMTFSADDQSLLWVQGQRDGNSAAFRVTRFPLGGSVEDKDRLPSNTFPVDMRLLPSGDLAVIAGQAVASATPIAPRLVFYSASGSLTADIALPGVLVGEQVRSDGLVAINTPGVAWDLAHSRLYVAHPEADVVTVVDLAGKRVTATVNAAPATSWLDPLGVGTAAAKLEPGNDRSVALSPDGSRLYVVGSRRTKTGTGDSAVFSQTPVGGFVLDTRSLKRVATIDLPVDRVLASPTGTSLVFSGTTMNPGTEEVAMASQHAELLLTDANLGLISRTRLAPGGWITGLTFDGSGVYVAQGSVVEVRSTKDLTRLGGAAGTAVEPSLH
jgi:DNA-binding beta-propeller fold protein YncE